MLSENEVRGLIEYVEYYVNRKTGESHKITDIRQLRGLIDWRDKFEKPPLSNAPINSDVFRHSIGGKIPRDVLHELAGLGGLPVNEAFNLSLHDLLLTVHHLQAVEDPESEYDRIEATKTVPITDKSAGAVEEAAIGAKKSDETADKTKNTDRTVEELLEAVRSADKSTPPARPVDEVTEIDQSADMSTRADQSEEESARATHSAEESTGPAHSLDFHSVKWNGIEYEFTGAQAACVKVLWEAWENGTPAVGQTAILDEAGTSASKDRLRDVFRTGGEPHPAFGEMIVKAERKGNYRLKEFDS